ncbi:MAG: CAP domain-containing protein [Anaerolineales bacterium]|jgi:hypothetical protein
MSRFWRKQLVAVVGLLIVSGLFVAVWWPASAGIEGGSTGAYFQYLPLISGTKCIPPPLIQPNDLERDIAVEAGINDIRGLNNLPRFANSKKIAQAALQHSNDMADNNFFAHAGSDGSGVGDRLEDTCYDWRAYGEIIAAGYRTPEGVIAAWMESPGHKAVILDPILEEFGAGYAYNSSSKFKHYWTVDFGLSANSLLMTSGDFHACSYQLVDEGGEIWVNLYTRAACETP